MKHTLHECDVAPEIFKIPLHRCRLKATYNIPYFEESGDEENEEGAA